MDYPVTNTIKVNVYCAIYSKKYVFMYITDDKVQFIVINTGLMFAMY